MKKLKIFNCIADYLEYAETADTNDLPTAVRRTITFENGVTWAGIDFDCNVMNCKKVSTAFRRCLKAIEGIEEMADIYNEISNFISEVETAEKNDINISGNSINENGWACEYEVNEDCIYIRVAIIQNEVEKSAPVQKIFTDSATFNEICNVISNHLIPVNENPRRLLLAECWHYYEPPTDDRYITADDVQKVIDAFCEESAPSIKEILNR